MNHFSERSAGMFEGREARPEPASRLTPRIESLTPEESLAVYVGDSDRVVREIRTMRGPERDRLIMRLESEIGAAIGSLNREGERYVDYAKPQKAANYFLTSARLSTFLNQLRGLYMEEDRTPDIRDAQGGRASFSGTRH